MAVKIRLMLRLRDGVGDATIDRALCAEADRMDRSVPGRLTHRRAFRLADAALCGTARDFNYTGGPPFDAMLETVADEADVEAVFAALDGFAERLAEFIDREHSAALVGVAHDILRGEGRIHIAIGARRLPHFDHEGYIGYWYGDHSNEARATDDAVGGMGYRQIHLDLAASEALARRTGLGVWDFDGMSETYFADAAALEAVYNAPGIVESAFADEQTFVDHKRSVFSLFLMADS